MKTSQKHSGEEKKPVKAIEKKPQPNLKTDWPLSEKDEVKAAEANMNKAKK